MHSSNIEAALLASARKLPVSLLRKGLLSDHRDIRCLCVKALDRSSRLRKEDGLALIESELPARERIEALRIGLKRGWSFEGSLVETTIGDANLVFGEDDELRLAFHSRRSMKALIKDLKWVGGSPWTVYAALGLEHFDEFAARIREDLESDFLSLRNGYRREVERAIRNDVKANVQKSPMLQSQRHI